jgi:hypothetical protein
MKYDMIEHQLDTLSQAVELLLQHAQQDMPLAESRLFRALRDELLSIRTERARFGGAETPESLHPPLENVRPRTWSDEQPPAPLDG